MVAPSDKHPVRPQPPTPCYVSGKGMHATRRTWDFKMRVILALEESGLGHDTRYRYYRPRFPDHSPEALARLVCDPIEYYDPDWIDWRTRRSDEADEAWLATEFMLKRDRLFRGRAEVAIIGLDEAGFGSGVNCMRFLAEQKPILGFYGAGADDRSVNRCNFLQLAIDFPELVTLHACRRVEDVPAVVLDWLAEWRASS